MFDLDNQRMMGLLRQGYPPRIPPDETDVVVSDYLRNRSDLQALKRSGAVHCSFFRRLEDQRTTRGTLAISIADHRVQTLSGAFLEGFRASPHIDQYQRSLGMDVEDEMLSSDNRRTQRGLFRTAMIFTGLVLDCGEFQQDEKSLDIATLFSELLEDFYKDCNRDIDRAEYPDAYAEGE